MRALDVKNLNNGEYLVIAVQDDPFEPTKQTKYFKTCKCSQFRNTVVLRAVAKSGVFRGWGWVLSWPLPQTHSMEKVVRFLNLSRK